MPEYRLRYGVPLLLLALTATAGCSKKAEAPPEQPQAQIETLPGAVSEIPSEAAPADRPQTEQDILSIAYAASSPKARLGARLYNDNRLSNPGANLAANCRTCHVPPEASNGRRQFADTTALSVIPANAFGSKQETIRNAPTLLDVSAESSFNADGEWTDLREYVAAKLTSTHMGWIPGQEDYAKDEIYALMINDIGQDALAEGSFIEQFKTAKGIDLGPMSRDEIFLQVIESIIDYLDTIQTHNTSAYDALAYLNRFDPRLTGPRDTPQALSGRLFGRIAHQEESDLIRFPQAYTEDAYQGLKTFFRVAPSTSATPGTADTKENIGNCVACHVPPKFSDGKFHNIGITQAQYDTVHGDATFAALSVDTPSKNTKARVDADDATKADLGRWNIDPRDQTFAAFKTPKLRFPEQTSPYMHNGAYDTLEDAIRQHLHAAELAQAGTLRNPDPALLTINITEQDIPQLAAFLRTLEEVPPEQYQEYRKANIRPRQNPNAVEE